MYTLTAYRPPVRSSSLQRTCVGSVTITDCPTASVRGFPVCSVVLPPPIKPFAVTWMNTGRDGAHGNVVGSVMDIALTVDQASPVLGGATSDTVTEGGTVTLGATDSTAFRGARGSHRKPGSTAGFPFTTG